MASSVFPMRRREGRRRLADLKIDRPVLDLHHNVVVELTIERLEIVIGCPRAVVLGIVPIHVVVVDEAAVEE